MQEEEEKDLIQAEEYYEEQASLKKVLERVVEENMWDLTHRHHGCITVTNNKGSTFYGTGLLISPNLVLTSAHNIYGFKPSAIKYSNRQSGVLNKFCDVEDFFVPDLFKEKKFRTFPRVDMALLKLKDKIALIEFKTW